MFKLKSQNFEVKKSLAQRLIVSIVFFSSITTLLLTSLQLYTEFRRGESKLIEAPQFIEKSYLKPLIYAVWGLNYSQIENILKGIQTIYGVEFLSLEAADGKYFNYGVKAEGKIIEKNWKLKDPSYSIPIGSFKVQISYGVVYRELKRQILSILFVNFFKTLIVISFMYLLFGRLILNRLNKLIQCLKEFSLESGQIASIYQLDEQENKNDEISFLIYCMSKMVRNITQAHKEIRGLTEHLLKTQEIEREKLAKELHDGVGQLLNVALIHSQPSNDDSEKSIAKSKKIGTAIRQAEDELRSLYSGLYPTAILEFGLKNAIEWNISKIIGNENIDIKLDLNIPDGISQQAQIHLYRIIQEAFSNTLKYAKATQAGVQIYCQNEQKEMRKLNLYIWDNGIGITEQKEDQKIHPSHGMANMKYRVALLKGILSIKSNEEIGTHLYMHFPLEHLLSTKEI